MDALARLRQVVSEDGIDVTAAQWAAAEEVYTGPNMPDEVRRHVRSIALHEAGHAVMQIGSGWLPIILWASNVSRPVLDAIETRNCGASAVIDDEGTVLRHEGKEDIFVRISYIPQTDEACVDAIITLAGGSIAQARFANQKLNRDDYFAREGATDFHHMSFAIDEILSRYHPSYAQLMGDDKKYTLAWYMFFVPEAIQRHLAKPAAKNMRIAIQAIADLVGEKVYLRGNHVPVLIGDKLREKMDDEEFLAFIDGLQKSHEACHSEVMAMLKDPHNMEAAIADMERLKT